MKRILGSLFVIVAVVSVGILSTSAYFSVSYGGSMTITSGKADFALTQLGAAPDFTKVGPGWSTSTCVRITNDGDFALNMTETVTGVSGNGALMDAIQLRLLAADSGCNPTGTWVGWFPLSAYNGNPQAIGTLAKGGTAYVVQELSWIDNGNQNALQSQSVDLAATIDGRTP